MSTYFSILAMRTQWTAWKGKKIWHQKMSSAGQKVSNMLLGKSGGQSLTVPERMKWLGQSRNDAHLQMCLVVKVKSKEQYCISSVQFSSVTHSCPTFYDPMNRSTPALPVHHQLPEFTQTQVHQVSDAIQQSHPLSSPSPAPNPSQHQSLFQWVNSSHEVAKALEFQL